MRGLKYNDRLHQYSYNWRIVPSVTQIIKASGASSMDFVLPSALKRGMDVHAEISERLTGQQFFIEPVGEVAQAMQFIKDCCASVVAVEEIIYHAEMDYAGRMDCILHIAGKNWLIDWKCGSMYKGIGMQMAAYECAWNRMQAGEKNKIDKVAVVVLKDTYYQLIDRDGPLWGSSGQEDWNKFQAARSAYGK